jgi:hypothetical protein
MHPKVFVCPPTELDLFGASRNKARHQHQASLEMLYNFVNKIVRTSQLVLAEQKNADSLWAPALNDTSHKDLFRIVSNIQSKSIYNTSVVSIRALSNFGHRHMGFHRMKYSGHGHVKELTLEVPEFSIIRMLFIS